MEVIAGIFGGVVAIAMLRFMFRFFFEDAEDFSECVRFSLTPDILSLFKGEYLSDMVKSFKFSFYLLVCLGSGLLSFLGLLGLLGG